MHSALKTRGTSVVYLLIFTLCLSTVCGGAIGGYKRAVAKRYAMMDLALSQIYDLCDQNGDRMLTFSELQCVQKMGNSILGRRKK